jgi:hypothetical protein
MLFSTLLRRLGRGSPFIGPAHRRSRTGPGARRQSFVPRLEALEGRALPSTLTVTTLQDSGVAGDGSLRGELAAAQPGDTITFQPGLHGSLLLGSTLSLTRNVTVQGNLDATGNPLVTLDGQHRVRDVLVNPSVTASLVGLGIADGFVPGLDVGQGGGIFNQGTLTVQSCTITGNWAGSSQVYSSGFATGQGGGIYNLGTLTVQNSTLSGNTAGGVGGAGGALMNGPGLWVGGYPNVWKGATATVVGSTISGNAATRGGGIFQTSSGGGLTIRASTITGNMAADDAGGIFINWRVGGTALTAAVSASATTLAVQSTTYFVTGETIQLDNEQMTILAVDALHKTLTVTRGVNGTAAAHLLGAKVFGLTTTLDAFTLAHLLNNNAPSNANTDGVYLSCA